MHAVFVWGVELKISISFTMHFTNHKSHVVDSCHPTHGCGHGEGVQMNIHVDKTSLRSCCINMQYEDNLNLAIIIKIYELGNLTNLVHM